jgi:beta-N-acetylhexosaminidase
MRKSTHRSTSASAPFDGGHAPVVLDVAGLTLSKADQRRLAHPLVGGVVLFARNWQDRAQLTRLCAQIKAVRPDALICVDHEGGRVQRFRTDGFTHLPPMRALGQAWLQEAPADAPAGFSALEACNTATACGYVLAAELRACGVDLSFAPVLDLDWGPSGVIGDRAFAQDPRIVTLLAKSLMQGLLQAGMAHCGKHFPGHGFVAADSHTEVPVDDRAIGAILRDDAAPYAWLSSSLASVMPAHVIYPQIDSRPAGFSRTWLQGVLREHLGFGGAVFSDDLSMAGARRIEGEDVSYAQAAALALQAGCDLVLLCNQSLDGNRALDDLLADLSHAAHVGLWQPSASSEARRLALLPQTPPLPWDDLMHHAPYQAALERLADLGIDAA